MAIYRMMRPASHRPKTPCKALFQRLFYNPDTYDLSRVGRMKFNAKIGREIHRPHGAVNETSWPWSRSGGPAQRQWRSRRHRPPGQPPRALRGRTGENQYRTGLARIEKA